MQRQHTVIVLVMILVASIFGIGYSLKVDNHHDQNNDYQINDKFRTSKETKSESVTIDSTHDEKLKLGKKVFLSNSRPIWETDTSGNIHTLWLDDSDKLGAGNDDDLFYRFYDNSTGTWEDTKLVTDISDNNIFRYILVLDTSDNVHIIWEDYTDYNKAGTDRDIFHKVLSEGDLSESKSKLITVNSDSNSDYKDYIVNGDNIHVIWSDTSVFDTGDGTDEDLVHSFYNASIDTWSTPEVFSDFSTNASYFHDILIGTKGIHVFYTDYTDYSSAGTDKDLFHSFYEFSTGSWQSAALVTVDSSTFIDDIVVKISDSDVIYAAWTDDSDIDGAGTDSDIFYNTYKEGFSSRYWTGTTLVTDASTSNYVSFRYNQMQLTVDGAHFFWREDVDINSAGTDYDIFHTINGYTELITTESDNSSFIEDIVVDNSDNIHILYSDRTDYNGAGNDIDLFYKRLNSEGLEWTNAKLISFLSTTYIDYGDLRIENDYDINVFWEESTPIKGSGLDEDIFHRKYIAELDYWASTELVSEGSNYDSNYEGIEFDKHQKSHVFWTDRTDYNNAGNDLDLFYRQYNDQSNTWFDTMLITTDSSLETYGFALQTRHDDSIHIVWEEKPSDVSVHYEGDYYYSTIDEFPIAPTLNPIELNSEQGVIDLTWNNIESANNYNVYRSESPIHDKSDVTPITQTTNNYYVDTVSNPGHYYYAITSVGVNGESDVSNYEYIKVFNNWTSQLEEITENHTDTIFNSNETTNLDTDSSFISHPLLPIYVVLIVIPIIIHNRKRRHN